MTSTDLDISDNHLLIAAAIWKIDPVAVNRSIEISGSPERSELRFVIEGRDKTKYILESIIVKDIEIKRKIITRLDELNKKNLHGINPYLVSQHNKTIEPFMGRYWKLSKFIDGIELKRPEYVFDKWRGKILADFLIQLRKLSDKSEILSEGPSFSLKEYILKISGEINQYNPEIVNGLEPVYQYLQNNFINSHDKLKTAFCHGDYHPVNVIWGNSKIRAVIDWEFSGIKPEFYDAANLLGCLGIEQPDALAGPFAIEFIEQLKKSEIFSKFSWQNLLPYIVALRFAWLAEWLRREDTEMIDLEIIYMKIIIDNEQQLTELWNTNCMER